MGVFGRYFICQNPDCKKRVDMPYDADHEEYGYWYTYHRCCSYSCMRKLQKKLEAPKPIDEKKRLDKLARIYGNFPKLEKFINLMQNGACPDDAAKEAGFNSLCTAVNYRYKYYNTPMWKEWIELKAKENGGEVVSA